MNKNNPTIRTSRTLTLAVFSACLLGCGPDAVDPVTVLQNEAVDAKTRTQIQLLNARLLNGFIQDDDTAIRELFTDDVLADIESDPGLDRVFEQIRGVLVETAVAPFHEFDITLAEASEEDLNVPADGNRGFSLVLKPAGTRMHVSLVEAKADVRDHLLGLVYTRPDPAKDVWRLASLRVGGLRIDDKDAMAWHAEAERLDEQGLHVAAAMRLMVAGGLLRPVPFMRYDNEAAVLQLEQRVSSTLAQAHEFPLRLDALPGSPGVIRLEPVFQRRQLLTLVSYVSAEKAEQPAVDAEVLKIHAALAELFPGLCHGSTRVAYKAFAEPPVDPQKSYSFINAVAPCAP